MQKFKQIVTIISFLMLSIAAVVSAFVDTPQNRSQEARAFWHSQDQHEKTEQERQRTLQVKALAEQAKPNLTIVIPSPFGSYQEQSEPQQETVEERNLRIERKYAGTTN